MIVRCVTDGPWPSLALLRIAVHHRQRGDTVLMGGPSLFDARGADRTYASCIFRPLPGDVVGGPASENPPLTVESLGIDAPAWQEGPAGITYGQTQRGCSARCPWCVVWRTEGARPISLEHVGRGNRVRLLDPDFFGTEDWRDRICQLRRQCKRVSMVQGINLRTLTDCQAAALVRLGPWDTRFRRRTVYTSWDRTADREAFFQGLNHLHVAGLKPARVRVYMLLKPEDDLDDAYTRYRTLRKAGAHMVYPMVWRRDGIAKPSLVAFQHAVLAPDEDPDRNEGRLRRMEAHERLVEETMGT